jgi:hypothetical protein
MITDIIVGASAVATLVFVVAWAVRPDLRRWIERPKYHFLTAVQRYDHARPAAGDSKGSDSE